MDEGGSVEVELHTSELAEGMSVAESQRDQIVLNRLRRLAVMLDHGFGTSSASLDYLQRFPDEVGVMGVAALAAADGEQASRLSVSKVILVAHLLGATLSDAVDVSATQAF